MSRITACLLALPLLLTGLWLSADTALPEPLTWFTFRDVFIQYTGVIGIAVMSLGMLLAGRPRWLERPLRGLDKMYRLHKWLGITGLVVSLLHWWWARGTKWMVGWGWLERPARGRRPAMPDLGLVEGWLRGQRHLAESIGEWAFYAVAVLIVLALVKRFPYRWFARTHTLLAPLYLLLVFHTVVLARFAYWSHPLGWCLAALLLAGTWGACMSLSGRIGKHRTVAGTVSGLQHFPELDVLEIRIVLRPGWPGHAPGQFAFLTVDPKEGPHPYTIASAWNAGDGSITFIAKALGDHTRTLRQQLSVGRTVHVEGPYGCFADGRQRHIWIGAGIGITPFVARMQDLAGQSGGQRVDLFHPTSVHEQAAIARLRT